LSRAFVRSRRVDNSGCAQRQARREITKMGGNASFNNLAANNLIEASILEFTKVPSNAGHGGYIGFRFNGFAADCASRIIEDSQGRISVYAAPGAPGFLAAGAVLMKNAGDTGGGANSGADGSAALYAAAYGEAGGEGVWVAGGKTAFGFDILNNGDIYWSTVANSTFGSNNINGIACGNGRWVSGGANGKMAYFADGINWTAVSNSTFASSGVTYGDGKWIAVGGSVIMYTRQTARHRHLRAR
jgi:hypothetical protein